MRLHIEDAGPVGRAADRKNVMKAELAEALEEALRELEMLPESPEGGLIGLYAIMDDLRDAIRRTEAMDLRRCA